MFKHFNLVIPVQFSAMSTGDGYWGMDAKERVDFNEVRVSVTLMPGDDNQWAEICFQHEHEANDLGLCYTDKGIEQAAATFCARHPMLSNFDHIGGSEQGMQGNHYLSCDANIDKDFTEAELLELGFVENT